jgi:RNA polymerase sigma factor (TIGR02999 family)
MIPPAPTQNVTSDGGHATWSPAERVAAERAVYDDLYRTARRLRARERPDITLRTTGLVHEAYLALAGRGSAGGRSGGVLAADPESAETHVSPALYAETMRRVLVGEARRRLAVKRGSGVRPASLSDDAFASGVAAGPSHRLGAAEERVHLAVDLDAALGHLRSANERACRVVELKFFGDLDHEQIADELGVCARTVKRDWDWARTYLQTHVQGWAGADRSQIP